MRKLLLSEKDKFFSAITEKMDLYLPVDTNGGAQFALWKEGTTQSDALNTGKSPKDFFFPQTEDLMAFRREGKKLELVDLRKEKEDFAVFGVRACDVRAFDILDNVFLKEPVDTYYQNRRAHGIILSLCCNKPAETCFCGTFGIDPADPKGDVACFEDKDYLYLQPVTEKGKKFLSQFDGLTEECPDTAADETKKRTRERMKKLPFADLKPDAFGGDKTDAYFASPVWKELSASCLGCGTCTFVCPTCQCYDIKDVDTGHGVARFRCWDSCMYSEFTKMSAGQPRLTQTERFRQRFMHKLVYYPANNDGLFSCVGCGRCVAKCPIHMNIVKVMKALQKEGEKHD